MINKKEKNKIAEIINISNNLKLYEEYKKDNYFWLLKIKEICEELIKW